MSGIVAFIKDIFTFSDDDIKVGLSQFRLTKESQKPPVKKVVNHVGDVKLSDLMRKSH